MFAYPWQYYRCALRIRLSALCIGIFAQTLLDAEMVFENITGDNICVSDLSTVARILFDVSYIEEATVSPTVQNSILRRIPEII